MYTYFTDQELMCPCGCGSMSMDEGFMYKLEKTRAECDFPFIINSAYRCEAHNEEIGGAPSSMHLFGRAVDVSTKNMTAEQKIIFLETALKNGLRGIGVKQKGNWQARFFHVDDSDPRIWSY